MARERSIAELKKELAGKEKRLAQLEAARARLLGKLDDVEEQIAHLTGQEHATQARPRHVAVEVPASPTSLIDFLTIVLTHAPGPMKAKDIHDAVLAAGYKTRDKRFVATVGKALAANPRFNRRGRGMYVLA
jgi:uncharacterized coiled-coil protein SlyX